MIMADKVTRILLDALKQAWADPAEQPLYKSGKLNGLFSSRTGASGEAASIALRDGLLQVVRTEAKGKGNVEWVRPTPRAVEFLHRHESPVEALKDLQGLLQTNRQYVPLWLAELQRDLHQLSQKIGEQANKWTHRLDGLSEQVQQALNRIEAAGAAVPDGAGADSPWAVEILTYLDRRRTSGAPGHCPLPELFAALREAHNELSVQAFHDTLRRLQDRGILRLLPFEQSPNAIPAPEYALVDGSGVLYFVTR
jgi:hypothetical protein